MTAVFAYADGDNALVAADTRRTAPGGFPGSARKVHRWSETVVFAQSGEAEFLTQLIGHMLRLGDHMGPTDEKLVETFRALHARYWQLAVDKYAGKSFGAVPAGSLLVASAAAYGLPARITKLDFQSGLSTPSHSITDADGSSASEFQAGAARDLAQVWAGNSSLALDDWAMRCVSDAVAAVPVVIDWPADILLTRLVGGHRVVVGRRVQPGDSSLPLFAVP
jgi:hypothetical protein